MSITPNYVPREYKTFNIILVVKDAHRALKFYNNAFGAEITMCFEDNDKRVIRAEMKIEDTIIMLMEENAETLSPQTLGGTGVLVQIYTGDAEGLYEAAIMAGAKEIGPIKEQFYGDRSGRVIDPFGHQWVIATHMEDVPARELQKRFHELYS